MCISAGTHRNKEQVDWLFAKRHVQRSGVERLVLRMPLDASITDKHIYTLYARKILLSAWLHGLPQDLHCWRVYSMMEYASAQSFPCGRRSASRCSCEIPHLRVRAYTEISMNMYAGTYMLYACVDIIRRSHTHSYMYMCSMYVNGLDYKYPSPDFWTLCVCLLSQQHHLGPSNHGSTITAAHLSDVSAATAAFTIRDNGCSTWSTEGSDDYQ